MTTVINTPGSGNNGDNSGLGMIMGILITIVVIVLFLIYGLPAIRSNEAPKDDGLNINVTLPTGETDSDTPSEEEPA
jgi:uncharacterized membrane protein